MLQPYHAVVSKLFINISPKISFILRAVALNNGNHYRTIYSCCTQHCLYNIMILSSYTLNICTMYIMMILYVCSSNLITIGLMCIKSSWPNKDFAECRSSIVYVFILLLFNIDIVVHKKYTGWCLLYIITKVIFSIVYVRRLRLLNYQRDNWVILHFPQSIASAVVFLTLFCSLNCVCMSIVLFLIFRSSVWYLMTVYCPFLKLPYFYDDISTTVFLRTYVDMNIAREGKSCTLKRNKPHFSKIRDKNFSKLHPNIMLFAIVIYLPVIFHQNHF